MECIRCFKMTTTNNFLWCEQCREKNRNYLSQNYERISRRRKTKVICECGCIVALHDISTHRKLNKHRVHLELEKFLKSFDDDIRVSIRNYYKENQKQFKTDSQNDFNNVEFDYE